MAGSQVIQEFLAKIGFQLDGEGYRKFLGAMQASTVQAAELGIAITAASASVTLAIKKIADGYNDLYYVAQRNESAVSSLRSIQQGGALVGETFERSRASVESMGRALRMNPGAGGFLRGLGITETDPAKALIQFYEKTKNQPHYIQARMAGDFFGIDEAASKKYRDNLDVMKAGIADYDRRLKEAGLDTDALARKSVDFNRSLTNLTGQLAILIDKVADKWLPSMKDGVDWLDKLAQGITTADRNTNGWLTTILSIVGAMGAAKAAGIALQAIGLRSLGRGVGALGGGALTATAGIAAGALVASTTAANAGEQDIYDKNGQLTSYGKGLMENEKSLKGSGKSRRQQAIEYFMAQGWTREQAAGLAANIQAESSFNPGLSGDGGKAYGLGQWHPDRQANFARQFGKDIRQSTFEEQLAFMQWELMNTEKAAGDRLRKETTAGGSGSVVSRFYERPAAGDVRAAERSALAENFFRTTPLTGQGGANVQITQSNEINVTGVSDPQQAADKIKDNQARAGGDLVRNTAGALR